MIVNAKYPEKVKKKKKKPESITLNANENPKLISFKIKTSDDDIFILHQRHLFDCLCHPLRQSKMRQVVFAQLNVQILMTL